MFMSPEEVRLKKSLPSYGEVMVSSDAAFQNALQTVKGKGEAKERVKVLEEGRAVQEGLLARLQRDPQSEGRDIYVVAVYDRIQSTDAMIRALQEENSMAKEIADLYEKKDESMVKEHTKRLNSVLSGYGIDPVKTISGEICIEDCKKK